MAGQDQNPMAGSYSQRGCSTLPSNELSTSQQLSDQAPSDGSVKADAQAARASATQFTAQGAAMPADAGLKPEPGSANPSVRLVLS
jgi:hypothetical protein